MRSLHRSRSGSRSSAVLLAGLAAATLLAGCSGSDSTSAEATQGAAGAAPAPATSLQDAARGGAAREATGEKAGEQTTVDGEQKLVRTATLSLKVKDIAEATAKVRAVNVAADGVILSENIGSYRDTGTEPKAGVNPSTYAVLVISVPVAKLDGTLDELQNVGQVLDRRSDTENVTAEYVDVQARVASMKKSVARVQDLINQTTSIDQLMRLEQELSQRQADLEAIEARLASLDRQTARSPITVNLATEPSLIDDAATNPADGFTGGLQAGWTAFVASLVALLAIVGALLPFVLFAALVGIPLLWLWRRLRTRRSQPPAAATYYPPPGPHGPPGPSGTNPGSPNSPDAPDSAPSPQEPARAR